MQRNRSAKCIDRSLSLRPVPVVAPSLVAAEAMAGEAAGTASPPAAPRWPHQANEIEPLPPAMIAHGRYDRVIAGRQLPWLRRPARVQVRPRLAGRRTAQERADGLTVQQTDALVTHLRGRQIALDDDTPLPRDGGSLDERVQVRIHLIGHEDPSAAAPVRWIDHQSATLLRQKRSTHALSAVTKVGGARAGNEAAEASRDRPSARADH